MNLNITFATSVASAPAEFKTAVAAVAQFFETTFSDPVTININVEYGRLNGLLGHSDYQLQSYSYSQITAQLAADSKSSEDANAIVNLPAQDPIQGTHHYVMTTAQAKALGLLAASTALDGTATFSSDTLFDYDRSDGITPGHYDFYGSVAHEFSEIMGRELNAIGNEVQTGEANGYYPYDLFKYTAAGVHGFVGTTPGYFSLDGGTTNLDDFNHNPDDDFGDWAASAGNDSFLAFSSPGVVNAVTATDLRVMDVLGWDLASPLLDVADARGGSGGGGGGFAGAGSGFGYGIAVGHAEAVTPIARIDSHIESAHVTAATVAPMYGLDWHLLL